MTVEIDVKVPVPEGAVVTCVLGIVSFIDSDGENKYAVATKGNAPMTTYLGMTLVAQQEILGWGSGNG